uniref:hypothetical protein n=1 Tax=Cellvibrio fontiphilus TaxID=1815559 RepID=UPI002B4BAEB4|nr:hypothetical protein [Cellvibrio fontiphilus]
MKNTYAYFLFFSLGAATFWSSNTYFMNDEESIAGAESIDSCPDKNRVAYLENENNILRDQIDRFGSSEKSPSVKNKPNSSVADASANSLNLQADQNHQDLAKLYEQVTRINSLSNYLSRIHDQGVSLHQELESGFSVEPVDYVWAQEYEQKIRSLINQHNLFGNTEYVAVVCKTHRCQIKLTAINSDEINSSIQAFAESVNKNNSGIAAVPVLSAVDASRGELDLYIAKDLNFKAYE